MNNKYKIIKYKIILFFISLMFISMSALIIYFNLNLKVNYNNGNIQKVYANIDDIKYYEYGIKKKTISYIIYSFNIDNEKIIATNIYNEIIDISNKNTKTEIYYNKMNNEIADLNNNSKLILSAFFMIIGIIILIFAIRLEKNNIHTWNRL